MSQDSPAAAASIQLPPPRRFWRRHRTATIVATVTLVILAIVGYTGWKATQLARNLQALQTIAEQAKVHATAGDMTALSADLTQANQRAHAAKTASRDLTIQASSHVPWLGDNVRALQVVSDAAADLTTTASRYTALLPRLTAKGLASQGDGFDLTLLAEVSTAAQSLGQAATRSANALDAAAARPINATLRSKMVKMSDLLSPIEPAVDKVQPLVAALSIILGGDGQRTWFVTMQNLTEARPSGGLVSAYVILQADHGKLKVLEQGSNDQLATGPRVPYAKTMPVGYQQVWGDSLGEWLSMNLSANFPDNAKLIHDGWNLRGGTQVDSVLALGQGTLPYLAAAVGTVKAGTKTISPKDLTKYLTVGIYRDYANPAAKDNVVAQIINEIFTKLTTGNFDLVSLLDTSLTYESADYLQMWSADTAQQQTIQNARFSGELTSDRGPLASVRLINAGGNKLDAFVALTADYKLGTCTVDPEAEESTRTSTLTVTVTNNAPTSGLPPYMTGRADLAGQSPPAVGSNHDYVVIYAPADATLLSFDQGGAAAYVQQNTASGREFAVYDVELAPGKTQTLTTTWSEPARRSDGSQLSLTPQVIMQPLLTTPVITTKTNQPCA